MKHIFGKKSGQSGFSLVELMIVVGIIGVLATLALPRFKQFQSKAKLAEAQNVLQHIYTLEQAYLLDNNAFIAVAAHGANTATSFGQDATLCAGNATLGFKIEPCDANGVTPRFAYSVATATSDVFVASATTGATAANRVCPGNAAFIITRNNLNISGYTAGTTTAVSSNPPIGTLCPNG